MTEVRPAPQSPGISRAIPPLIFMLCLGGGALLDWFFFHHVEPLVFMPLWLRVFIGALVFVGGATLMAWGFFAFKLSGTPLNPAKPASHLVDTGAFAISRNPMYVGFVALLVGIGIIFDSMPLLVAAFVMFFYLDRFVIRREEAYLIGAFGERYNYYRHQVRRWL